MSGSRSGGGFSGGASFGACGLFLLLALAGFFFLLVLLRGLLLKNLLLLDLPPGFSLRLGGFLLFLFFARFGALVLFLSGLGVGGGLGFRAGFVAIRGFDVGLRFGGQCFGGGGLGLQFLHAGLLRVTLRSSSSLGLGLIPPLTLGFGLGTGLGLVFHLGQSIFLSFCGGADSRFGVFFGLGFGVALGASLGVGFVLSRFPALLNFFLVIARLAFGLFLALALLFLLLTIGKLFLGASLTA